MVDRSNKPFVPPVWFKRTVWAGHRLLYHLTKRGLARPSRGGKFGMLRLRTQGRRTGKSRAVILGYFLDGERFVTLAMNGWSDPAPGWWCNLRSHPSAEVDTVDGIVAVTAREATGDERARLWAEFEHYKGWGDDLDRFVAVRSHPTPVVVLEPA